MPITLIYAIGSANAAKESVAQAKASVDAAIASVNATREQIGESKYQSVYQQQLALWQLAAEHPKLATEIIGGTDTDAARALTVDFYAYVYSQLAPPSEPDRMPISLALDDSDDPAGIDKDEWRGWQS